jgi:hypothetical protein
MSRKTWCNAGLVALWLAFALCTWKTWANLVEAACRVAAAG